jgi:uncharacterized protein YcbK (DUF882 family)
MVKPKSWKFGGRGGRSNGKRVRVPRRAGLTPRGERILNAIGGTTLALLAIGWSWTIAGAALADEETRAAAGSVSLSTSLTSRDVPITAYLTDAMVSAFARPAEGDSLGPFKKRRDSTVAGRTGTDDRSKLARNAARVASRFSEFGRAMVSFDGLRVVPLAQRENGRIGTYRVGRWPTEGRANVRARYEPPSGFIEVTQANQDTYVSEHFRLRDFLTKDQQGVWPKYLVLEPRLIEKLELTIAELEKMGHTVDHVSVLSGFRTPQYNSGGGNTSGRADLSRHMYGDAADIFVDNDRNGWLDDLNRNGRSDRGDSQVQRDAADRVERARPDLIGGVGVYPAASGHGPFTHIDTRGYRARW